jgi:4-nitrophenyl phosphatase
VTPPAIVCDLDGVVYLGDQEVPGAGRALAALDRAGARIVFATNNSYRTRRDTAAKIARVTGYPADPEQVVSSATAAVELMGATSCQAVLTVGGPGVREAVELAGHRIAEPGDHVDLVVAGVDFDLTYARLAEAGRAIRAGAGFVATNRDATFPSPTGLLPGAGAIVAALEVTSGVEAMAAGKPYAPMRSLIRRLVGAGSVWVVGDRPDTDLAMAHAEGWTSVLVLTGVTPGPEGVDPPPDHVIGSIAELPALVASSRP